MHGAVVAILFIIGLAVWSIVAVMQLEESRWLLEPGNPIRVATWVGAIILMAVALLSNKDSLFASFRTEAVSLAIAVIVLDELGRYRAYLEDKNRVIRQMASHSKDFAFDALRLVTQNGWHKDGSLEGIDLGPIKLPRAHVPIGHLRGSRLRGSKLRWSNLADATLESADLRGAQLDHACMCGTNLTGARLQGASLRAVRMSKATILAKANFQGASFPGARLEQVSFHDSIICGADFRHTYMATCVLTGAMYDNYTQFPPNVNPKARGAIKVKWDEQSGDWVADTTLDELPNSGL